MSRPTPFGLTAKFPLGVRPTAENFARTRDLFMRLQAVHPLFATISPKGRAGSIKRIESEPLLLDIDLEKWLEYYELGRIGKNKLEQDLGVRVPYWNRHHAFGESQLIDIKCDATPTPFHDVPEHRFNAVMIHNLVPPLIEPEVLDPMMAAAIESFECNRVEYKWLHAPPDGPNGEDYRRFLIHKFWLREGESFPHDPEDMHYPIDHPPPPEQRPWLGGTLYTWPEHEPKKLLAELGRNKYQ